MRKCFVKVAETVYESPSVGRSVTVEKPATFHQFGTQAQYSNNGDERISISVAIVELEDGKVLEVDPSAIRFSV